MLSLGWPPLFHACEKICLLFKGHPDMKFCFSLFQFQIQKERWHLSKQGQDHLWSLRSYLYCQRSCVLPVQMAHKLG